MTTAQTTSTETATRTDMANAIRALSMDAVQQANSGHPGMPMGMADIAQVLWCDVLKHNPADPTWPNRDRFVLSNGHGSMLLYSLLHLCGYDLPIEELKNFRQLHSKTPGHPEYGMTPGVETTTGPLGQGLANAVGMALAESHLAARYNRPGHAICDHYTYVFAGDGCLMEGISHEACSLAGTLGLGKLIVFWDDNGISIDGPVEGWFTDDTPARFRAYGWHVVDAIDGHDSDAVASAIESARQESDKPTLIDCRTIIGRGSPKKQGKSSSHGSPLGDDEVATVRDVLKWPHAPFEIPASVYAGFSGRERGSEAQSSWEDGFAAYAKDHPALADEFKRVMAGDLPSRWLDAIDAFVHDAQANGQSKASRVASQDTLEQLVPLLPELVGGSADLTGSNNTKVAASTVLDSTNPGGNYLYYGVREFAMAAMMNGMALHGGLVPYGGTFLMFSEYARNALRMAALMEIGPIFVFTHDSVGLGEDGPTHQAVEQAATLRLMPNMSLWRPCDGVETAVAWKMAIVNRRKPTSLLLSRQSLDHQHRDADTLAAIARGGYILIDTDNGSPDAIVIATGSEVGLAARAVRALAADGMKVRLVSMPSTDTFDQQDADYKERVLPESVVHRVAVEAGVTGLWWKYVGAKGRIVGIDRFGESAPASDVFNELGVTPQAVESAVRSMLA